RDGDVPFGSVHSQPLTVVASDGVALRAEFEAVDGGAPGSGSDQAGPTVIFLHGWMLNMDEWYYQRLALRDRMQMLFYDHRGHGSSTQPERDSCTLGQLARDAYTAIEQLVPTGPIVLVGHSMGGMAIMAMAAEYPELFGDRIVGAVLCSTAAGDILHPGLPFSLGGLVRAFTPVLDRGRRFNSYSVIKRW